MGVMSAHQNRPHVRKRLQGGYQFIGIVIRQGNPEWHARIAEPVKQHIIGPRPKRQTGRPGIMQPKTVHTPFTVQRLYLSQRVICRHDRPLRDQLPGSVEPIFQKAIAIYGADFFRLRMIDNSATNAVKSHLVKEFSRILERRRACMRIPHTDIGVYYRYARREAEKRHRGFECAICDYGWATVKRIKKPRPPTPSHLTP